jgi:EAL domain-containing protein (putative c-di-GMP-specific phosphodiesterase class I)
MPGSKALRLFIVAAVANLVACTVLRVVVLLGPDAGEAGSPDALYPFVVAMVLLTPLQVVPLWIVMRDWLRAVTDRRRTRRLIDDVLANDRLTTAFQPIIDVKTRRVVGVEALSRFPGTADWTPDVWFTRAAQVGLGIDLELAALRRALTTAERAPAGYVAFNVSPAMLAHPLLLGLVDGARLRSDRIVLEITEHEHIDDYGPLLAARTALRARGIRLAVDDAGAGYSSLRHIVTLAPDMIKIDRSLVSGLADDPARRSMIGAVVGFGTERHAKVVAEGVETGQELAALARLGVGQAQGFFIARPSVHPEDWAGWDTPGQPPQPVVSDALYVI